MFYFKLSIIFPGGFCVNKKCPAKSLAVYSGDQKERSALLGVEIPLCRNPKIWFCCPKLLCFFLFLQAPPSEKLPVAYLMDSIVKNVGKEYVPAFAKNLVLTFLRVFEKVRTLSEEFGILNKTCSW